MFILRGPVVGRLVDVLTRTQSGQSSIQNIYVSPHLYIDPLLHRAKFNTAPCLINLTWALSYVVLV